MVKLNHEITEEQAYNLILGAGATRAIVSFSGGGDEGGADDITLTRPGDDGQHVIVAELEPYAHGKIAHQALTQYLEDLPSTQYGSFNGDVLVDGTIVVDAETRTTAWTVVEEHEEEVYD